MPNPSLKKAMKEIKEVLSRYDLGGIIILHNQGVDEMGYCEFFLKIDPSYSCATFESPTKVRFKAKASDYGGNKRLRNKKISDTANLLNLLSTIGGQQILGVIELSKQLDKVVGSEHGELIEDNF